MTVNNQILVIYDVWDKRKQAKEPYLQMSLNQTEWLLLERFY